MHSLRIHPLPVRMLSRLRFDAAKAKGWFWFAGSILALWLFYWRALHGYFLSDDLDYPYYFYEWEQAGNFWGQVFARFGQGMLSQGYFYRPIGLLSFAIDYKLYGTNAFAWHTTSFFLHCANGFLVWRFARQLSARVAGRASESFSLLAAGLFMLHSPIGEVTVWIAGRHDALAVFFGLLCLMQACRGARGNNLLLVMLWLALALASKESAVMLVPVLLLLWRCGLGAEVLSWRRMLLPASAIVAVFVAYLGWRWWLFGSMLVTYRDASLQWALNLFGPNSPQLAGHDFTGLGIHAAQLAARFFIRLSTELNSLRLMLVSPESPPVLAILVVLFAAILVAWGGWRSLRKPELRPLWLFAAGWIFIHAFAVLLHGSLISEQGEGSRFFYISAIPVALILAYPILSSDSDGGRRVYPAFALLALFLFASGIILRLDLKPWENAGSQMSSLHAEIGQLAASLPADRFALLMIPDHLAAVPFGRNAQGALVSPPIQPRPLHSQVIPLLPQDVSHWAGLVERGEIAVLRKSPSLTELLPADRTLIIFPNEYWCWSETKRRIVPLQLGLENFDAAHWKLGWSKALAMSPCSGMAAAVS